MEAVPYNPGFADRVAPIATPTGLIAPMPNSSIQMVTNNGGIPAWRQPVSSKIAIGGGPTSGPAAAYGASPQLQVPPSPGGGSTGVVGGFATPPANMSGSAPQASGSSGATTGAVILGAGILGALLFL